ncbi:T9SS C-terminal target domain-containing protein [Chryseobacterium indologenes]|uniref:fibronectin type III domain-containing protein n=1 Tax=Chryseobacterium indologenes TaxID=253 RepID=UPI000B517F8E|nr:fibronectin type III domain-containing protein [Chryseobacterium indologenes]ASE60312.1 T9SS C-terminal target domain-containing protein [Chryseobacterium indologenes]
MKKLLLSCMMSLGIGASAQILVNEGFEGSSLPSGWTSTNGAGTTLAAGGYGSSAGTACQGTKAVYKNIYDGVPSWNMVYTSTASNATALNYSFKYLAKGYNSTAIIDGTVAADYSVDNGATWVTILSPLAISGSANTIIPCTTVSGSIPAGTIPAGAGFKLRLKSTAVGTGDFYMGFDDVQLTQDIISPPACNTISTPANAATGVSVTPTITWAAGTGGTNGYNLYLGTTPGGNNIINGLDVGNVTSYSITAANALSYSTQYYATIVPRNVIGSATGCNGSSFTTTTVPCPAVSAPAASAVNVSVNPTFTWSAVSAATGYKLRIGTTAGGSDVLNDFDMGNVTSYTLPTSLNNATTYYYTVKSYTATSLSASCTEKIFTTVCLPTSAPYSQNFDTTPTGSSSNVNAPTCWSYVETSGSAGYGYVSSTSPSSTPNCYILFNSTDTTGNVMLVSPQTTNLTNGTKRVKFMAKGGSTGYTMFVGTLSDPSNPASFAAVGNSIAITTSWASYVVNIPAGSNQYLAFKHGLGGTSRSVYIDDVVVEDIPSCLETTGVTVGAVTLNSVDISWTAPSTPPANGYDIYYSTTNVAPLPATAPSITAVAGTSATIPGLLPYTTYYIWVRSRCSGSDQSVWTSAVSAYTGHCIPTGGSSNTLYYYNNITTNTLGYNNLAYTAASYSAYVNNSSTSFSGTAGGNIDYSLKASGGGTYYYYIWVDWNNDLDFNDAGETMLAATTAYAATASGSFAIPAGQPMGDYRVRFGQSYSGTITSCGPAPSGNYVDFTLSVVAPATCIPPTGVAVSNIAADSAAVFWTASTTPPAAGYDMYYSTSNTAPTASTVPVISGVTGTSQVLTTLTPATTYYVWVRSHCSANDTSAWSVSANFKTACAAVSSLNENFDSSVVGALPSCWLSIGSMASYAKVYALSGTMISAPYALYLYTDNSGTGMVSTPELLNLDSNNYMISFKGRANLTAGGVVQIGYLTDSANTGSFVVLGTYTTTGTTVIDNYSLNITGVPAGVNKLVLKHTGSPANSVLIDDFNFQLGNLSTSEVTRDKNEIRLYPNPFSEIVNISDVSKVKSVQIVDAAGRVVKTIENLSLSLHVGDLKQGMYLVVLNMKDGTKQTIKTIKK